MEVNSKLIIRIANQIHEQLVLLRIHRIHELYGKIRDFGTNVTGLVSLGLRLGKSEQRKWFRAAERCISKMDISINDLQNLAINLSCKIKEYKPEIPSLRDIYGELIQVRDEFGQLEYDTEVHFLSVFTDPIELEGIFLGDFEIRLLLNNINNIAGNDILRVIALDAHPAAVNDAVTHPHVSDEILCTGDATVPLKNALADGRICDFFILVRSVLENYNPSSPHVALSEWEGILCYECGYSANEDESCYCELCDHTVCHECSSYCKACEIDVCLQCVSNCKACEEYYCNNCLTSCNECEESYCGECMSVCSECDQTLCNGCLEDGLCPACKENQENEDEEDNTNDESRLGTENQPAGTPVQPDCVG